VRAGWILCGVLACLVSCPAVAVTDSFSRLAKAYVVEAGGREIWAGRADEPLPPASLTKVMTALLVLEDYQPERVVTVSPMAARATGSRLRLRAGEKLTVRALLTATLIASANDACVALAESSAGSVEEFVSRMNARAHAMGLANTHFANPCGFDAPGHYSSARDLARLAHEALSHAEFATLVATPRAEVVTTGGRIYEFKNKNALIGNYAPARGVKTGYTEGAGKCLIALARKGDVQVLLVMLNASRRWWDAIGIIENAFDEAGARPAP
jgi:D-alanyl-D-alanine carboxypeptidase (penicillin-binding protein 5/6)